MCYRCRRVRRLCVCGIVRGVVGDAPVRNRLGITILQDRKEALKRPFGSAIVCELALENCTSVWYDTKVPETVPFPEHLRETRGVGVLFPGPGARRLRRGRGPNGAKEDGFVEAARRENQVREENEEDASDASDAEVPTHLIVIDTTWHRARRMYARIPWIKTLPAYVLGESTPLIRSGDDDERDFSRKKNQNEAFPFHVNGAELELDRVGQSDDVESDDGDPHTSIRLESGYRIRKQPKPGFLSTAECVAAALREGEPDDEETKTALGNVEETSGAARGARAAAAVEACFDEMIDAQVRSFSDRKNVRYRSRKAERAAKEAAKEVKAGATEGAETTASASASKNAW